MKKKNSEPAEKEALFANYLRTIRRILGWSAKEFADKIGVSQQTISNIERKETNLTKTQYLASRAILMAEMERSEEDTKLLKAFLEIYIDNPDGYSEEEKTKIMDRINILSPSITEGTATRKMVSDEMVDVIGKTLIAASAAILTTLLSEKNDTKLAQIFMPDSKGGKNG